LTERNEAQAKLEIFRTEMQNLRDHISSPLVQKNIREKVANAKRVIEKKTTSKEDLAYLKSVILFLEEGFARVQENEKIYHRLLLQKEIEIKNMKEFNREIQKKTPKVVVGEMQDSKMSTVGSTLFGSVDVGSSRKSLSFSGCLTEDFSTQRKKKENYEFSDSRLIDELALFKVKYALFEETVSERDEKLKAILKKAKEITDKNEEAYEIKQNLHFLSQILKQPIIVAELQIEESVF
jgi:hypothetical protein